MKKFSFLFLMFTLLSSFEILLASSTVSVANFKEFENALKNPNVTTINVTNSFHFTKNIVDIPNRDITIDGNKDLNVVIYSDIYSIYGKQNYKGRNTFSIVNANINGSNSVGRFFTGGAGNGPSSYGWDVYASDVTYAGARFVHLSEGTLTFDGDNIIFTSCENAWVHSLVFKAGSTYKGSAATIGQFSAFYFNGALIKGKAIGTVEIEESAQVDLTISPYNDKYYYYPAFYDKVHEVNVQSSASLKVNAAGVAFQFIPRADYIKTPSFNIGNNAKVELIGRGGGNYATVKLQYYKNSVNAAPMSTLIIKGNSCKSVIESIYKGAEININRANFSIENKRKDAPLFCSKQTTFNLQNISLINTWPKLGGLYETPPTIVFTAFNSMKTVINKSLNGAIETNNATALKGFQVGNYGKIATLGGGFFSARSSAFSMDSEDLSAEVNNIQCFSQDCSLTVVSDKEISSLEVYSLQGALIVKERPNNTTFTTRLTNGVFIVKALVDGKIVTKKVMLK